MSSPAATLFPIFATPFATAQLEGAEALNAELAPLLEARANRRPDGSGDPLSYCSQEDLFDWPDEPVARLRREMLAALRAAVEVTTLHTSAEFGALGIAARARFAIVRPNGCLGAETPPLASWCAIYCVAAPPGPARPDSGALRLYEPRLGTMFLDAVNWRMRPPFAGGHHLWRPTPGHMAAFPGAMPYEIALNRSDSDLMLVLARVRFTNPGQQAMPPW